MSTAASNSSSSSSRGKTSVQQQRPQNAQASSSRLPPLRETAAVDLERELPTSLRPSRLTFSSLAPSDPETIAAVPALMHDLPPAVYASKLAKKLVPLSNPPRASAHASTQAKAKARRRSDAVRRETVGLLSRKEAKRRSVWAPARGEMSADRLRGLGDLWEGYARELLGLASEGGLAALRLNGANLVEGNVEGLLGKLAKAEFVGARLTVKSAPNADLVGLAGIVIHETANTFKLVTARDAVRVVPKDQTVFTLTLPLPAGPPSSFHASASSRLATPDASISSLLAARPALSATTTPRSAPSQSNGPMASSAAAAMPINAAGLAGRPNDGAAAAPAATAGDRGVRLELDLFGSQFRFRSADRAGRKFKTHGRVEMAGSAGMKL